MVLTREHFCSIIFYNFRHGLSLEECIDELKSLFGDKAPSYNNIIIFVLTPEIGQGLGRILSCGARKPEQT